MANVIHGTPSNLFATPKLVAERVASGSYRYYYNGRMVEVQRNDGDKSDGVESFWMTLVNGEFDKDFATKREAVVAARRYLGII